jgi:hypothetical protein
MHDNSKTARVHGRLFPQPDDMCSCNCTSHSFFSSDSSSSSSSFSSPDSHAKEALMISISSTAPPRKKEKLLSTLQTLSNTSTKLHSSKPITGSIKQAPNLTYKKSVSQLQQATAARARNPKQNKTKQSCRKASINSFIPLVS